MITGGNRWRANEIVIPPPIRQTATRYRCRDRAIGRDPSDATLRSDESGSDDSEPREIEKAEIRDVVGEEIALVKVEV
jgi:hypothetical protein